VRTVASRSAGGNGTCWSTEYCIRNCEGYRVYDAVGPLGYVEDVRLSQDGQLEALVVRDGGPPVTVWPRQLLDIEPGADAVRIREVAVTSEQIAVLLLRGEQQGRLCADEVDELARALPAACREALLQRIASRGIEVRPPDRDREGSTTTGV
jgi:hypothetical protein